IPPGQPSSGVSIPVYEASKQQPAETKVAQHIMLIEPNNGTVSVAEIYDFQNDGKKTWNNPDARTLHFALPPPAHGEVEINVLAPGGLPIRRAADPLGKQEIDKPNTFKLDFPIKPGQSEIRMQWSMPLTSPGVLEDTVLAKDAPAMKVLAPTG